MLTPDERCINEVVQGVLAEKIHFTRAIGAMVPTLYLTDAYKGKMGSGFNQLDLINGDQLTNYYAEFVHTLRENGSHAPAIRFLTSNPLVPWSTFKVKESVRLFLINHAYYHYLHGQFWFHYEFFGQTETGAQINVLHYIRLQTQAMLMCFYSKKPVNQLIDIYNETINKRVLGNRLQRFRFELEFSVLLIHYGSYSYAQQQLTSLEDINQSISDPRMTIEFNNVCSLLYYKLNDYEKAFRYLDEALRVASETLDYEDDLFTYLRNNKEKLLHKCTKEVSSL
ncbi:hypothetical protein [Alkalihalobacillus sp. AL-G]|uniref:hypothetical protein n=1 Tax=Alkalihalobacillus sp. AL-G TaxID=2926399 RepID=UPI00272BC3F2|nr:hypothetical protein [Alkalihalobacillus sp. AL-G]WLD93105.1 hypothetical protein MOJ78_19250 [Alkalihalobacillus sp. AL-G]